MAQSPPEDSANGTTTEVQFLDFLGRVIRFKENKRGFVDIFIDGRHKVKHITHLSRHGETLQFTGRKYLLCSEREVIVHRTVREEVLDEVVERFRRCAEAAASAAAAEEEEEEAEGDVAITEEDEESCPYDEKDEEEEESTSDEEVALSESSAAERTTPFRPSAPVGQRARRMRTFAIVASGAKRVAGAQVDVGEEVVRQLQASYAGICAQAAPPTPTAPQGIEVPLPKKPQGSVKRRVRLRSKADSTASTASVASEVKQGAAPQPQRPLRAAAPPLVAPPCERDERAVEGFARSALKRSVAGGAAAPAAMADAQGAPDASARAPIRSALKQRESQVAQPAAAAPALRSALKKAASPSAARPSGILKPRRGLRGMGG